MRIQFKALLETVQEIEQLEKTKRQKITLKIPVYDTFTGEPVRNDVFPAAILGKNINRLDADKKLGEIVSAICFLTSFSNEKEDVTYHNLSLNCVELDIIDVD